MAASKNTKRREKPLYTVQKNVVLTGNSSGYHVEDFLGEGGFGKVAKCTKLDTGEIVAVKIVRKDLFREGRREARMLNKLRQLDLDKNNLVKFREHFKFKGHFCLVFEKLDLSIFDLIKSKNFMPLLVSDIRVIAQQMLVALDALKSINMVHGDIKPDNLMLVNHQSQSYKVKLIDFGLATNTSKLWWGGTLQTIGYRAPEIILGIPMDEGIDIWSLGCTLAYMYLGQNLYPTHCEYEAVRIIVQLQCQPTKDLLESGFKVKHFFTQVQDSPDRMFRLNTPAEYTNATGFSTEELQGIYNSLYSLDDLPKMNPEPLDPTECNDTQAFISLLKQMLTVDQGKRITPREALGHNFLTMKLPASSFKEKEPSYLNSEQTTFKSCHGGKTEMNSAGKCSKDGRWNTRTIIKVRPLYPIDKESEDRAESATTVSKDEPSANVTTNGTHEKLTAAETESTTCKEVKTSDLVEVKTHKKPFKRIQNFFSRIFNSITSCRGKKRKRTLSPAISTTQTRVPLYSHHQQDET